MRNLIHHLRSKPEHIRERIAYGTAGSLAIVLSIVWVSTSLTTTGILAPTHPGASFAQGTALRPVVADAVQKKSSLLGSAVSAFTSASPRKAYLEIVNVRESSTLTAHSATSTERTTIPF